MKTLNCKLSEEEHRKIAAELYQAEKAVSSIPLLTERYPDMTMDDAYSIQKAGLAMRLADGAHIVGRKIGITSAGMMNLLHVNTPDYGYLLDTGMILQGDTCRRSSKNIPLIECEIAFLMGEDLTGPAVTPADVLCATRYVVPCFELCDARYPGWNVTVCDTISDNAGASAFMIGSQPKPVTEVNLRNIGLVVEKNGVLHGTGAGAEVLGSPVNSMVWLVNKLAEYGDGLKKGDIVLSGAFIAADPVKAGDSYTCCMDGFPPLSIAFEE